MGGISSVVHFTTEAPGGMTMTDVNAGLANFDVLLSKAVSVVTDNPVLMLFLAGGLLVVGFRVFKKAKKAVR